jgi:hypothetical protein
MAAAKGFFPTIWRAKKAAPGALAPALPWIQKG